MRRPTIDGSICQQTQHCEHRTIQHDKTHSKLHGATALKKDILRCSRQSHCTTWSRKDRHPSKLSHSRNVFAFSLPNLSSHCCSHQLRVCPIGLPQSAPRCSPPLSHLSFSVSLIFLSLYVCVSLLLSLFLSRLFVSVSVCLLSVSVSLSMSQSLSRSLFHFLSLSLCRLFVSVYVCLLFDYVSLCPCLSLSLSRSLYLSLSLSISPLCFWLCLLSASLYRSIQSTRNTSIRQPNYVAPLRNLIQLPETSFLLSLCFSSWSQ